MTQSFSNVSRETSLLEGPCEIPYATSQSKMMVKFLLICLPFLWFLQSNQFKYLVKTYKGKACYVTVS